MTCHHWGPVSELHLQPQSPQVSAKKTKTKTKQKTKQQQKKRALQPSTTHCCSHPPGNTPTLQLPLPNTSVPRSLIMSFSKTYNWEQLVQHLLHGLGGTGCFLCGLRWWGKATEIISDSRGGCGLPPLGVH